MLPNLSYSYPYSFMTFWLRWKYSMVFYFCLNNFRTFKLIKKTKGVSWIWLRILYEGANSCFGCFWLHLRNSCLCSKYMWARKQKCGPLTGLWRWNVRKYASNSHLITRFWLGLFPVSSLSAILMAQDISGRLKSGLIGWVEICALTVKKSLPWLSKQHRKEWISQQLMTQTLIRMEINETGVQAWFSNKNCLSGVNAWTPIFYLLAYSGPPCYLNSK